MRRTACDRRSGDGRPTRPSAQSRNTRAHRCPIRASGEGDAGTNETGVSLGWRDVPCRAVAWRRGGDRATGSRTSSRSARESPSDSAVPGRCTPASQSGDLRVRGGLPQPRAPALGHRLVPPCEYEARALRRRPDEQIRHLRCRRRQASFEDCPQRIFSGRCCPNTSVRQAS